MPSKDIFCSAPWYELHIYWDGGLGFCCQEASKLYPSSENKKYNVASMSIREWVNSQPMTRLREDIKDNTKLSTCSHCYTEERYNGTSRRHRTNQKSVIFTRINFKESYEQSPGINKFKGIEPIPMPIDLHIDLGNYCNLTCKMCWPVASSSIAVQEVKWGNLEAKQYVGSDWTRDQGVWDRVVAEIASIPKLSNVHFMGGETLITPRFKDFVRAMLDANRTNIGISFVSNGTHYDPELNEMLRSFKRVGIEISIESLTPHNRYQRQGTDTQVVLDNISRYIKAGFEVTLRPAISALTIGSYYTLLEYALKHKLLVKGLIAETPPRMHPAVIPREIRQTYAQPYLDLLAKYSLTDSTATDYNESDSNQYRRVVQEQIERTLQLLNDDTRPEANLRDLVSHCSKWDNVHGYNAIELYPELAEIFKLYGY